MTTKPLRRHQDFIDECFDPIDYGFKWEDDWYKFDHDAAHKAALKARNSRARELRKQGWQVSSSTTRSIRSMGGIGTDHPYITLDVNIYRVFARL